MKIVEVTRENILSEHICCAISNNDDIQVKSKKQWLIEAMDSGVEFLKSDERGKCFIEYIPAEYAFEPISAEGYNFIDCFWVAGKLAGNGYASQLLEECINKSKAKGKLGLTVISSKKKTPFFSDGAYLKKKGFMLADEISPYFELLYLPFKENAAVPKFKDCAKSLTDDSKGFKLYYSNQCPYTAKYVPIIEEIAKDKGVEFTAVKFTDYKKAQCACAPKTTYSLFYDGKYIGSEILSEKKFIALIDKYVGK